MTTVSPPTHNVPPAAARPPAEHSLGLPQSTALIMGSIIGVGIFSLPYSLASYGPISLVAMGLATVGAVALALMFAVLSRRLPADGGPYAYARAAFGNGFGFSQRVVLLDHRVGRQRRHRGRLGLLRRALRQQGRRASAGRSRSRWSACGSRPLVNLTGVRNMGAFQVVDHGPEVHPAGPHGDRRAVLHQRRQLHALEHQR